MFDLESDVRKVVRDAFPNAQWVESAIGGSFGLPDCFINDIDGLVSRVAFFELKVGVVSGSMIKFTVRPAQRKRLRLMLPNGYKAWFLVGEQGGDRLWRIYPTESALHGKAMIVGPESVPILDVRTELLAGAF